MHINICVTTKSVTTNYYIKGKLASADEVIEIKKWRADRGQQAADSQGLKKENAVVVSIISFSNITQIHANKQRIFLSGEFDTNLIDILS